MPVVVNPVFIGPDTRPDPVPKNPGILLIGTVVMVCQIVVCLIIMYRYLGPETSLFINRLNPWTRPGVEQSMRLFFKYLIPETTFVPDREESRNIDRFLTNIKNLTFSCQTGSLLYTWKGQTVRYTGQLNSPCEEILSNLNTSLSNGLV